MYLRQRGFLPALTFWVGFIFAAGPFVGALWILCQFWGQAANNLLLFDLLIESGKILIVVMLYGCLAIPPALLFGGMFPDVRITSAGIKYRSLQIVDSLIRWHEVAEILELKYPRGFIALLISRGGHPLWNGLWFNSVYGKLWRIDGPILLLSPGLENRDRVLDEIRKNCCGPDPLTDLRK